MTDTRTHRDPMSTDRWQRVQDVFAAAIECDDAARAQLLGDRCGDDPDLRREVESLLASHDRPGPVDRLAPAIALASRASIPGPFQRNPAAGAVRISGRGMPCGQ